MLRIEKNVPMKRQARELEIFNELVEDSDIMQDADYCMKIELEANEDNPDPSTLYIVDLELDGSDVHWWWLVGTIVLSHAYVSDEYDLIDFFVFMVLHKGLSVEKVLPMWRETVREQVARYNDLISDDTGFPRVIPPLIVKSAN